MFEELLQRAKRKIYFGQRIKSITAPKKFRFKYIYTNIKALLVIKNNKQNKHSISFFKYKY